MGAVTRSKGRDRRPTTDEFETILKYFEEIRVRRKQEFYMVRVTLFVLFSRKSQESTGTRWTRRVRAC
jgi:hypothetical protein